MCSVKVATHSASCHFNQMEYANLGRIHGYYYFNKYIVLRIWRIGSKPTDGQLLLLFCKHYLWFGISYCYCYCYIVIVIYIFAKIAHSSSSLFFFLHCLLAVFFPLTFPENNIIIYLLWSGYIPAGTGPWNADCSKRLKANTSPNSHTDNMHTESSRASDRYQRIICMQVVHPFHVSMMCISDNVHADSSIHSTFIIKQSACGFMPSMWLHVIRIP